MSDEARPIDEQRGNRHPGCVRTAMPWGCLFFLALIVPILIGFYRLLF